MLQAVTRRGRRALLLVPDVLARLGLVDRERGRDTFEIAVPAMVSAGVWTVLRVTDFFMVSLALSDAAVAALEFAFQYYMVGFGLAMAVSSGTISIVSRFKGAEEHARADLAVKQSMWLAILISVPLILLSWVSAETLLDLLTDDSEVIGLGASYLRIVMLALMFRFLSFIGGRALEGCGDARTPMYVQLVVIPLNVVFNALLIFGLGPAPRLGIVGAAWGTTIANTIGIAIYAWIYLSGRFAVRLRLHGPHWDTGIAREIVRVATPVAAMSLTRTFGRFPFLFIVGVLGTQVVAAFAIGRRIMALVMILGWGYSTSASTLVGQSLGRGEEDEATSYALDTLTIAIVTQVFIAGVFAVFARQIALLFDTGAIGLTAIFIQAFALSVAGNSIAQTFQGSLRGAGDTTWPFYGTVLSTVLRLGIAALALPVTFVLVTVGGMAITPGIGLGVTAVLVAIVVGMYARAAVIGARFWSGQWKVIARRGLPDAD